MPGATLPSTRLGILLLCVPFAAAAQPLVDRTESSGLDFVHFNGMTGELYFIEMMGSGGALFDYDADGDLDLYVVQGHLLGDDRKLADAVFPPAHAGPMTDRLYRNDSLTTPAGREIRFTDVTEAAGIDAGGYGMGVAAGDIDNDGYPDLYVMNYGSNQLLRNRGDGTFEDVTAAAGVDDERWSVSASFVDYDRDGWLDLYVGNYLKHDIRVRKVCRMSKLVADYCGPSYEAGETDRLFRNLGNGRFDDVTRRAGIDKAWGGALGVIAADFDGDRWPDLYVANDGVANQLWINQRDGTFRDDALLAGVAVNRDGMPEGSMGVDAQDFDGDGDPDLFLTHFDKETNTLYVNDGTGLFEDESIASGLGQPSFRYTAFGVAWFDLDNDGWLDVFSVNGAVRKKPGQVRAGDPHPLKEPNQLFVNTGDGRYRELGVDVVPALEQSLVSRGAVFGDLDNDGDTDIVVLNNAGPAQLLANTAGQDAAWVGLDLQTAKRSAYGAVARVTDGARVHVRQVRADGSYASANDPRIIVGLRGSKADTVDITVAWPDGRDERFEELAVRRYHRLEQGAGQAPIKPGDSTP